MRFKVLYMVLVLSLTSILFADKAPIRISAGKYYNQFSHKYYPQVTITSVSDKIIIKDVIVNKGNCRYDKTNYYGSFGNIRTRNLFPKKLLYGQKLEITVHRCNILRVDVKTNQGTWTAEY